MTWSWNVKRVLAAASIAALLAVSACGDDDDDDDGAAGGNGSAGAPIKIMTFTSLENPGYSAPQKRTAAEASVKAINDAGGINGSRIEFEFCDTNFDPNMEAACARKAVEEGFVAVMGSTSFYPNTLPILERGGVAYVGGQGLVPAELKSGISFPIAGGVPGWVTGAVALGLQERGVQRPAIVQSPIAAAQFGAQYTAIAFQRAGVEVVRTVDAPVGAPDQSAAATQAADGTDAVFIAALPSDASKIIQSLGQSGYTGAIVSITAIVTQDSVASLGDAADGMLLSAQVTPPTNTDNPAVARFIEEMDAIDPSASKDERSMATWASMQLVAGVIERIDGEVTAASVLEAFNNLSEPVETGVTPPYSVVGKTSPLPDLPRIFNPTVVYTEVQGGRVVQVGDQDYVDGFAALDEIAGR